jgi:hypothetical protein
VTRYNILCASFLRQKSFLVRVSIRNVLNGYLFLALHPLLDLEQFFIFLIFYTVGRAPWMGEQPLARSLPKHRTTQTQNKRIYTPIIHALSEIRTHDPSVRASGESSCLRIRGHCDRRNIGARCVTLGTEIVQTHACALCMRYYF